MVFWFELANDGDVKLKSIGVKSKFAAIFFTIFKSTFGDEKEFLREQNKNPEQDGTNIIRNGRKIINFVIDRINL